MIPGIKKNFWIHFSFVLF